MDFLVPTFSEERVLIVQLNHPMTLRATRLRSTFRWLGRASGSRCIYRRLSPTTTPWFGARPRDERHRPVQNRVTRKFENEDQRRITGVDCILENACAEVGPHQRVQKSSMARTRIFVTPV